MSFYDFTANSLNGKPIKMEDFKNKTVLVVNTASKCGLTPQYEGLDVPTEYYYQYNLKER